VRDFSHKKYISLLEALKKNGYRFRRFAELPLAHGGGDGPEVLLRHDVDRMPGRSMQLARTEAEHGAKSTYFFRSKPISFNKEIVERIAELGHEIGFHYESLSDAHGDFKKAWKLFNDDLAQFSPICTVKSIAMHGRPFSPWDNRDIWRHFDYRAAGIAIEAYEDIDWGRYLYFTDTGRRWNSESNVRDHVATSDSSQSRLAVTWTDDLIQLIETRQPDLVISTHPERWTAGIDGWLQVYATDMGINMAKRILKTFRGGGS